MYVLTVPYGPRQQLQKSKRNAELHEKHPRKRRKIEPTGSPSSSPAPSRVSQTPHATPTLLSQPKHALVEGVDDIKNGESLSALRKMIFGQVEHTENQQL
jgi:hypothetical protein